MTEAEFQDHALRIRLAGYTLLPSALSEAECDEGSAELRRLLDTGRAAAEGKYGPSQGWAYNLMNKARVFERVYQVPDLLRLVRHFLGEDAVLSSVQGRVVLPGDADQNLHYDGSLTGPFRPPPAADGDRRIVGPVLGFNVLFCLTEFTRVNGATRVVPGSHLHESRALPGEHPPGEIVVEAPRGTALVFNIALWHGATSNRSDAPRYMVSTPWRRSWMRPEADLSRMVLPEVLERAGPEGRRIFGFTNRPPYLERWQWDQEEGRPLPEWRHLARE